MRKKLKFFRITIIFLIFAYLQTIIPAGIALAEVNDCGYDSTAPDLEHARQSFKQINYRCAEQELNDLLSQEDLNIELKANAHVLLAAVYYTILRDATEKEQMVVDQFAEAFRSYQDWSGDLDIKSSKFAALMETAKGLVEEEKAEPKETKSPVVPTEEKQVKKKAWYTQWWAIALGVGVIAGVAVAAGGGSSDGGGTAVLADFPDTPSKLTADDNSGN